MPEEPDLSPEEIEELYRELEARAAAKATQQEIHRVPPPTAKKPKPA